MGYLKITEKNKKCPFFDNYSTKQEVEWLIKYITRTKENGNAEDLMMCGAFGVPYGVDSDQIIKIFLTEQYFFNGEGDIGPRLFHEIFWLTEEETQIIMQSIKWEYLIYYLAEHAAYVYFSKGFQVVYAVHLKGRGDKQKLHIHFAVNTVNFFTGHKFHTGINKDQDAREYAMNMELYNVIIESNRN